MAYAALTFSFAFCFLLFFSLFSFSPFFPHLPGMRGLLVTCNVIYHSLGREGGISVVIGYVKGLYRTSTVQYDMEPFCFGCKPWGGGLMH